MSEYKPLTNNQSRINYRLLWLKTDVTELDTLLGPDPETYINWQQALDDLEDKIRRIRARATKEAA
jgi:hypothetical protein